jgi:hypothetical protein
MGVKNAAAGAITGAEVVKAIYVMGGSNATYPLNGQYVNQVYFPEPDSWGVAAPMPIDRAGISAAVVNDTLYVIGGGHNIFAPDSTVCIQYTPFTSSEIEPFPATWIVAAIAIIIGSVATVLVYFRKIKKTTGKLNE